MSASDLIARIDAVEKRAFADHAFRHVSPGVDPRSGTGARIHGGRWNPPDSFRTLYLGLSPETVVAEFYRAARRQGLEASDFLPRDLHEFELRLEAVLDLTVASQRERLGLDDRAIRSNDAHKCQAVGEAAHYLGVEAILAPSATGVGTVAAVFLDRLLADSVVESIQSERWDQVPPEPQTV